MENWKYYNHAMVPLVPPHEIADTAPVMDGSVWKLSQKGVPLFARWTSEWDCKDKTEWWYCIKDTPFEIDKLKAKRRYEINKGIKNFEVTLINPQSYKEALYNVQVAAFSVYPLKYRPHINWADFETSLSDWDKQLVFGAFDRENNCLCGYARLSPRNTYVEFDVLKVMPCSEKKGINAALVAAICKEFNFKITTEHYYILDGSRPIIHESHFQDYLEKYFGFRKAYAKLHIKYRWWGHLIVSILYPYRKLFMKSKRRLFCKISSVLLMEQIVRNQ